MPSPQAIAKLIAAGASIFLLSACAVFEPRACTCPPAPASSASAAAPAASAASAPAAAAPQQRVVQPAAKPASAGTAAAAPVPEAAPVLAEEPSGPPGRIYFYRAAIFGTVLQPDVQLNGRTVGKAVPQEYFYVDRPPGSYEVTTTLKGTRSLTFRLGPGQTAYVEVNVIPGIVGGKAIPLLVEESEGKEELKHRRLSGR